MVSQITGVSIVYLTICLGANKKKKHQSSASLAFVRGIHQSPVNFPHRRPVTRKMFPFDDVIMNRDLTPLLTYMHCGYAFFHWAFDLLRFCFARLFSDLSALCELFIHCFTVLHDDVIKWKHFRVTGLLCGEFNGHRWITFTKASDAELWCFLWSAP